MAGHRLEITLYPEVLARLDEARGHEPRASFVKRVLEAALVESDRSGSVSSRAVERGLAEAKAAPVEKGSEVNASDVGSGASTVRSPAPSRQAPSLAETWRR